jgi:hypothetical protein
MNKTTQELVERFEIEPEAALRIQSMMEINFSECTQREFNDEALRVYESIVSEECGKS